MTRWIVLVLLFFGVAIGCNLLTVLAPATMDQLGVEADAETGTLDVAISYEGGFYTEVFGYTPDAENVRHYVIILPESEVERATGISLFTSLAPQPDGTTTIREDRQENAWILEYLYDAPLGVMSAQFEPGTYAVAVAFVFSPLSRENAEVDDDVVLWPGVTGGGASTDFMPIEITAGERIEVAITLTDMNGWACPWLYVFDGENYVRYSEILRNLRGIENARSELTPLVGFAVVDGEIRLRIVEEKDEISYIDSFYLLVDGEPIYSGDPRLAADDADYVVLNRGDSIDLSFSVDDPQTVTAIASGYYDVVE